MYIVHYVPKLNSIVYTFGNITCMPFYWQLTLYGVLRYRLIIITYYQRHGLHDGPPLILSCIHTLHRGSKYHPLIV